ncbi:MAG: carbon monoxide dehydrogenase subunit G [Pseudomonadota bacterium]|nr:carbon monoxide dehydrogenase subunit G [Pseudomonadota bacterium]MEE2859691.1 carbon monoxide dehydrogenase subunit G [Pseudomonadota bacterium]
MELGDEIFIEAPVEQVYAALSDPDVLRHCIPGCEELTKRSDTDLEARVALKVGPVSARFSGEVALDFVAPPTRLSLTGKGNGGAAGFASGRAEVTLTPSEGGTLLSYDATASMGGRIAQLGNRMLQGTARKLSAKFFERFSEYMIEHPAREGGNQ